MSRQFTWYNRANSRAKDHRNCTPAVIERFFDRSSLRSSYRGLERPSINRPSLSSEERNDDACLAEENPSLSRPSQRFQLWNALPLFLPSLKMEGNFSRSLLAREAGHSVRAEGVPRPLGIRYKLLDEWPLPSNPDGN